MVLLVTQEKQVPQARQDLLVQQAIQEKQVLLGKLEQQEKLVLLVQQATQEKLVPQEKLGLQVFQVTDISQQPLMLKHLFQRKEVV